MAIKQKMKKVIATKRLSKVGKIGSKKLTSKAKQTASTISKPEVTEYKEESDEESSSSESDSTLHISDLMSDDEEKTPQKSKKETKISQYIEARGEPDGSSKTSLVSLSDNEENKNKSSTLEKVQDTASKLKKKIIDKVDKKNSKETSENVIQSKKRKFSGNTEGDSKDTPDKIECMTVKDRKRQRKMLRPTFELSMEAKKLWEQLRRLDLKVDKKHQISSQLYVHVKSHAKELIFAHDTSRVIQCLMKYGMPEHRTALFEELKDNIIEMMKSKYAKFFVRALLKYGSSQQRTFVFHAIYGNVRKLIRHKEAADLIELAYNDYANAGQRAAFVEEFYGPSFALFKTTEIRTLEQIMISSPEKKEAILSNMKEILTATINKEVCQHSIIHRIFLEYFTYASEKLKLEMIESVREQLVHMLHTRDGAHVMLRCLWHGTAKDRKVIMKSLKTYIVKACQEEHGHLALLGLFDCVDDTKLVQKIILQEIIDHLHEVVCNQYGRKVIHYLLSPRNSSHFCPDIVRLLEKGDDNSVSKKEPVVRREELLDFISTPLIEYVCKHSKELIMNNAELLLLLSILNHAKGDTSKAMTSVAEITAEPFHTGNVEKMHIIENSAGHMALKRIITADAQRIHNGETVLFSNVLIDTIGEKLIDWIGCNRGCFILVCLLDVPAKEVTIRVRKILEPIKASLKKLDFTGAKILLTKLESIEEIKSQHAV